MLKIYMKFNFGSFWPAVDLLADGGVEVITLRTFYSQQAGGQQQQQRLLHAPFVFFFFGLGCIRHSKPYVVG